MGATKSSGRKAFTLIESLVSAAAVVVLAGVLFPLAGSTIESAKKSNTGNLSRIAKAAILYGGDYEERIPLTVNGPWRSLRNVRDGRLTEYGEQRTDAWPLLLLPYLKNNRETFVDPRRGDRPGVWSGPPLATDDPGFVLTKNTYRMQNREPMFGVNYEFLSPMVIPSTKMSDATPTDFMSSECRSFFQAWEPSQTIFYTVTMLGRQSRDNLKSDSIGTPQTERGDFAANAPGMWNPASSVPYVQFWTGTDCSGDWCADIDPRSAGKQPSTSTNYFEEPGRRNNVAFLDGHVRALTDVQMAAGTDYLTATPNSAVPDAKGGGSRITDKTKYLWDLDNNYYGRY